MKAGMDQSSSNVGSKYKSSVQRVKNKTLATLGDVAGDTLATADVSTDNNLSYNGSTSANGIQGRASHVLVLVAAEALGPRETGLAVVDSAAEACDVIYAGCVLGGVLGVGAGVGFVGLFVGVGEGFGD